MLPLSDRAGLAAQRRIVTDIMTENFMIIPLPALPGNYCPAPWRTGRGASPYAEVAALDTFCFENACAEGTLECGSVSYRRSLEFQCGSFAAALHDGLRIFMLSGCPAADGHERLLWKRVRPRAFPTPFTWGRQAAPLRVSWRPPSRRWSEAGWSTITSHRRAQLGSPIARQRGLRGHYHSAIVQEYLDTLFA